MAVALVIVLAFLTSIVSSQVMPDLSGNDLRLATKTVRFTELVFTLSEYKVLCSG